MPQEAFDVALLDSIPTVEILSELKRELGMREAKYPGWVASKKLKPDTAQRQMLRLRAGIRKLERIWADEEERRAPTLSFEGPAGAPKAPGDGGHR